MNSPNSSQKFHLKAIIWFCWRTCQALTHSSNYWVYFIKYFNWNLLFRGLYLVLSAFAGGATGLFICGMFLNGLDYHPRLSFALFLLHPSNLASVHRHRRALNFVLIQSLTKIKAVVSYLRIIRQLFLTAKWAVTAEKASTSPFCCFTQERINPLNNWLCSLLGSEGRMTCLAMALLISKPQRA